MESNEVYKEDIDDDAIIIRPVDIEDFDKLTEISRICFPEQFRWRATKSHSRKWWGNLINSNISEIWVCSIFGNVVAFIILTVNRVKYEEAKEKQKQHYSFFDALSIFMYNPKEFYKRIVSKLNWLKLNKAQGTESSTDESQTNIRERIKKNIAESIPWCGPIAVLPGERGRGISMKLWEHCFQRAKSLGYKEIYGVVEKKNIMSRIMMAIVGFKVKEEVGQLIFYKKSFEFIEDIQAISDR